jgi:hypothetical protein
VQAANRLASSDPISQYSTSSGFLTPKDYLNASATDPAPFEFCPVFGPGDTVAERRGQWPLLKSRIHTGSGARIQRVIQKAMAGMPITVSVLGGSGKSISSTVKRGTDISVRMSWSWRRPHFSPLLPIPIFRMVELGLSSPSI